MLWFKRDKKESRIQNNQLHDFHETEEKAFDLNIEKILENWEIYHAIREIIANALDEMIITGTPMIDIVKDVNGYWHIRDYGRGLNYHHLTQKESDEKKTRKDVIGKFGIGLKDAFAVLHKNNINVHVISKYGDMCLKMLPKEGFNMNTLHVVIQPTTDNSFEGTEFILNVNDEEVRKAKELFVVFRNQKCLDKNEYGEIYEKANGNHANIYVHGMKIAEEENYLFDYNITKTNKQLEKNLSRERSNVGRTAYSGIIKNMLLKANSKIIAETLVEQLKKIQNGDKSDEMQLDIQVHAIKLYNQFEKVVFISALEAYRLDNDDKEKIKDSKRKEVIIPSITYEKIKNLKDYQGNEIATFSTVCREYNENFQYKFVDINDLTEEEKEVLNLKRFVFAIYGDKKYYDRILISENINEFISGDTRGVYETKEDRIILKRSILFDEALFFEVLFHELAHATSGRPDNDRAFENQLGEIIGKLAVEFKNKYTH